MSSTYGYDLQNNMTSAVTGGVTTTYAYDYNGVLISEATNGVTTYFLNDPNNPTGNSKAIQESLTPGGAPTISYVIGLQVEAQSDTTNGTRYLIVDGHGSTRALTDSTGAVVSGQTFDYDAFGDVLTNSSTAETVLLFGGDGVYDRASGFTYQLARWRNGFSFTQSDPSLSSQTANPITLQRYAYADANPVMGNDPTGHDDDGDSLEDQAFGAADEDIAEDAGGYQAVTSYVQGQFSNVQAYAAMGFATGDLLAAGTSLDAQAVAVTAGITAAGAIGGILLEGGIDAFALADSGGGQGGADAVQAAEDIGEEESEAAGGECGDEISCFLAGTVVLLGNDTTEEPIQDIQVGQRVATDGGIANSPDGKAAADPNATAVNPATWRDVTIEAGNWKVQTLEPLSWIKAEHVHPGGSLNLSEVVNLQEMGVPTGLVGIVESISACPTIQGGSGRVVLTTVSALDLDAGVAGDRDEGSNGRLDSSRNDEPGIENDRRAPGPAQA